MEEETYVQSEVYFTERCKEEVKVGPKYPGELVFPSSPRFDSLILLHLRILLLLVSSPFLHSDFVRFWCSILTCRYNEVEGE